MNTRLFTLTFGCQSENHIGMQKIGSSLSNKGFTLEELKNIKNICELKKFDCILYNLHDEINDINIDNYKAYILVIKKGVNLFTNSSDVFSILDNLNWDKKYFDIRRQKVLNKHARYNLCFSNYEQEPVYQNKKGRIYNINQFECLKDLKNGFELFGENFKNLECEGNFYFDINKCGIGYHGDAERKKVIGCRFGSSLDLNYYWYYNYKRLNNKISIPLDDGDIYIMDEKASGFDWKSKNKFTLRHATGCYKYIK